MSDYIVALPVGAYTLNPALDTFTRTGIDGAEVIAPVFGGDNFVGEVLSGKWLKDNDGDVLASGNQGMIARLTSNHLELTVASHAAGNNDYAWIVSKSMVYLLGETTLIVELEVPSSVSSGRHVGIELDLTATYPTGNDPQNESDWLKIQFQNDDGTYVYRIRKCVGTAESDVVAWTETTTNHVVFKLVFREDKPNFNTHIYIDDGETGTFVQEDSSPYQLGLSFNKAFPVFCVETNDAVERTCYSDYVTLQYPDFNFRYEMPAVKGGSGSLFMEAEDETYGGGADTVDLDDDSGESVRLNAQSEYAKPARNPLYPTVLTSTGRYLFLFKAKDTAEVTNDLECRIYNETDGRHLNLEGDVINFTLEGIFKVYGCLFDVTDDDYGDHVSFRLLKDTATANTIYIDWMKVILYTGEQLGTCKCFDTNGSDDESVWTRVYDADHTFTGDCVIQNGLVRIRVYDGIGDGLRFYYYEDNDWVLAYPYLWWYLEANTTNANILFFESISKITSETVEIKIRFEDATGSYYVKSNASLKRGSYSLTLEPKEIYPTQRISIYYFEYTYRRFGYAGNLETKNIGDDDLDQSAYNATMTDNFLLAFDNDGYTAIMSLTSNLVPAQFEAYDGGWLCERRFTPEEVNNGVKVFVSLLPFSRVVSLFIEAEDATLAGGASVSADVTASGGYRVRLNAQNEKVYWSQALINTIWPRGRYLAVIRARDSNQVANDLMYCVYNDSDGKFINDSQTWRQITLTASWAYYQLVFDITDDEVGDTVIIYCQKQTVNVNNIYIDYFLVIPIGNGESWAGDVAHNATKALGRDRKMFLRSLP